MASFVEGDRIQFAHDAFFDAIMALFTSIIRILYIKKTRANGSALAPRIPELSVDRFFGDENVVRTRCAEIRIRRQRIIAA